MTNHDIKQDVHPGKIVADDLRENVGYIAGLGAWADALMVRDMNDLAEYITHLEAQIATVVEAERDECAMLASRFIAGVASDEFENGRVARNVLAAIRARGDTEEKKDDD